MSPIIPSRFESVPEFEKRAGLYYEKGFATNTSFEERYVALRNSEKRIYAESMIKNLPDVPTGHPHKAEWHIRQRSAQRLLNWIRKHNPTHILEVGCGNGWLINFLSMKTGIECCGVDVNEFELLQGVSAFGENKKLTLVYADIFSGKIPEELTDTIILASVIQYFPDLKKTIIQLKKYLKPAGVIHIIDSPFYDEPARVDAYQRSLSHFRSMGHEPMSNHYFHHSLAEMEGISAYKVYDPTGPFNRLLSRFTHLSPFPWIIIKP